MDYHFMTDFYGDENTSDGDVELTISDPVETDGRVQVLVNFGSIIFSVWPGTQTSASTALQIA